MTDECRRIVARRGYSFSEPSRYPPTDEEGALVPPPTVPKRTAAGAPPAVADGIGASGWLALLALSGTTLLVVAHF
jgi:hypothetical protein